MIPALVEDSRTTFARVWRGELSLYQAAYALGGVGGALGSLAGDYALDLATRAGGPLGWLIFASSACGELLFALVCVVATWRARARDDYARVAIGFAVSFVWIQFVLTAAWIGWSVISGLGVAPAPLDVFLRQVVQPEWQALLAAIKSIGPSR